MTINKIYLNRKSLTKLEQQKLLDNLDFATDDEKLDFHDLGIDIGVFDKYND